MKMSNKEVLKRLANAVQAETPNVLENVLARAAQTEGAVTMTTETYTPANAPVVLPETMQENKAVSFKPRWRRLALAAAAVLVIAFGVFFNQMYFSPMATVSFDVNPSIELKVSRSEKVLSATALNADAGVILDGMNLKNVDLNVAVKALIGSMVQNGYVDEAKNSVLITVESGNSQKGQELQQKLSKEVDEMLNTHSLHGSILSQQVDTGDAELAKLADTYGISRGKAALVSLLVEKDPLITLEQAAALSVHEINLLLDSKKTDLQSVSETGKASTSGYIGQEAALAAALNHAGVAASDIVRQKIELDYDDGRMVYEVDFNTAWVEFEYEIDAVNGSVVKFEREGEAPPQNSQPEQPVSSTPSSANSASSSSKEAPPANSTGQISKQAALDIAFAHAGVASSSASRTKVKLDHEDGRLVYEIEFEVGRTEYDYEIDAINGSILKAETDYDD